MRTGFGISIEAGSAGGGANDQRVRLEGGPAGDPHRHAVGKHAARVSLSDRGLQGLLRRVLCPARARRAPSPSSPAGRRAAPGGRAGHRPRRTSTSISFCRVRHAAILPPERPSEKLPAAGDAPCFKDFATPCWQAAPCSGCESCAVHLLIHIGRMAMAVIRNELYSRRTRVRRRLAASGIKRRHAECNQYRDAAHPLFASTCRSSPRRWTP